MSRPVFSVLIPAYNAASTIARAVNSAASQTVREIEIVIVDDGSSDSTAEIIASLSHSDERIRLVRLARNGGHARARNVALSEARGVWAAPLDADDAFHPQRLERLLQLARSSGADLVADNLRYVDGVADRPLGHGIIWSLEQDHYLLTPAEYVRNNIFGKEQFHLGYLQPIFSLESIRSRHILYDVTLRVCPDYQFYQDCLLGGARYVITKESYYDYYQYASSISRRLTSDDLARQLVLNREAAGLALDPELVSALDARGRSIARALEQRRLGELISARNPIAATRHLLRNPALWSFIVTRGPAALQRRLGLAPANWMPRPGRIDLGLRS